MFSSHLVQSENTEFQLMKTQRVLNRSCKCANGRYCKNQVFFTLFLRHLQGKTRYEIRQGWWFALWVGDPISFFVKYYYLNLTFIQVLKGALLKNAKTKTKTIFSKTMLRPKNYFIKQEAEEKHWKKRKKNKKWAKVKQRQ